jgi:hypothetical protein
MMDVVWNTFDSGEKRPVFRERLREEGREDELWQQRGESKLTGKSRRKSRVSLSSSVPERERWIGFSSSTSSSFFSSIPSVCVCIHSNTHTHNQQCLCLYIYIFINIYTTALHTHTRKREKTCFSPPPPPPNLVFELGRAFVVGGGGVVSCRESVYWG